jgi:uncharacterized repeat protein (TIGR01451 family)
VQLQVQRIPAPPNDTCTGAVALTLGGKVGSNASGTNDYSLTGTTCFTGIGQTSSSAPGRDTVYSFTAPAAGSYSFRAQTFDAGNGGNLVLYTAPTCPGPGVISCAAPVRAANRNTATANLAAAEEILCQPMAAGEQTFVFVDEGTLVGVGGSYLIEATRCGQEVEPNNTPATPSAVLACPMEGSITPAGDVDFFDLGTPAAGTRVFATADSVQGNSSDFDMRITTSTDTLEYDDADNVTVNGSLGPNIEGRQLTGVQSYVRMSHFNAGTQAEPYRLVRVLQPSSASASPELNSAGNNTLTGAETAANNYFAGTFSTFNSTTGEDLDAYKFCAVEGDVISVGIDADPGRNLTPINPAVFLFDEAGVLVLGQNDASVTSNNTSGAGVLTATTPNSPGESIVYRARYTGTYYGATNPQAATNVPAGADYLFSVGLNCENTSAFTATLGTDITAPASVSAGNTFDYTIHLSNSGPKTALDAEFVDTLPAGMTFEDINGTGTDSALCTQLPPVGSGGTVRCRVDCLRPGGSFDFVITVKTPQCVGGNPSNTVNVTSKTPLQPGSVLTDAVSINVIDSGACSDNQACTIGDHCQGSTCVPTGPLDCSDSDRAPSTSATSRAAAPTPSARGRSATTATPARRWTSAWPTRRLRGPGAAGLPRRGHGSRVPGQDHALLGLRCRRLHLRRRAREHVGLPCRSRRRRRDLLQRPGEHQHHRRHPARRECRLLVPGAGREHLRAGRFLGECHQRAAQHDDLPLIPGFAIERRTGGRRAARPFLTPPRARTGRW